MNNPKKLYIACHDPIRAGQLARRLCENGYEIVSTWHAKEFRPSEGWTPEQKAEIARQCLSEVEQCDMLFLLAGTEKYSGGKFWEAGYAHGLGKRVAIVGRQENCLTSHPALQRFSDAEDVIATFCPDTDYVYGA